MAGYKEMGETLQSKIILVLYTLLTGSLLGLEF